MGEGQKKERPQREEGLHEKRSEIKMETETKEETSHRATDSQPSCQSRKKQDKVS